MEWLHAQWKKLRAKGGQSSLSRDDYIFAGAIALTIGLAFLLLIDGYLLYVSELRGDVPVGYSARSPTLNTAKIDKVINLLDARALEFETLHTGGSALLGTSSPALLTSPGGVEPPSSP